ncbi:MAG: PEP-CTERM sorting domain-containing protein [Candidatus Heimdallarchaeota archaeon]|nr:PEP-CTERM sorting domain-containing protein [Candidatus Heimdallarchaeota archaeon]
MNIDLTSIVYQATLNSYNFLGLNLRMPPTYPEDTFPYASFGSLEYPKNGPKPAELHVETSKEPVVPEPSTMLLFGTGILSAFVHRRKQS